MLHHPTQLSSSETKIQLITEAYDCQLATQMQEVLINRYLMRQCFNERGKANAIHVDFLQLFQPN